MTYDFSDRVRAVLGQARSEAAAFRHDYIGTEHILLAMLAQDGGQAIEVLAVLGVEPAQLRPGVVALLRPGRATSTVGELPYTSRAKKVLEYAMASAREFSKESPGARRASIDTDHLLLGLIREAKGIAAEALQLFGVTTATATEAAWQVRRDTPRPVADTPTAVDGVDSVWFLQFEPGSQTPIYEQIIARIEEAVATNRLLPGERLPAVRDLAAELSVAPGTVARAYSALEQRGVLETGGARGTRVAERPPRSPGTTLQPTLIDLLRPVAVAAYHMGARAQDVHAALEKAMLDIFP